MLGEKLKKIRKENKISLEELASIFIEKYKTGTNIASLSRWENGKQIPDLNSLKMYCDYFKLSMDYLCGYSDIPIRIKEPTIEELRENLNTSELIELDTLINLNLNTLQKKGDLEEKTKEKLIKYLTKAFIESLENIKNNEKIGEIEYDVKNF